MARKSLPPPPPLELEANGELTLLEIRDWKPLLLNAAGKSQPVIVDFSHTTEVDFPALQFLVSAARTFSARSLALTFRDPAGVVTAARHKAGVGPFPGVTA